MPSISQVTRVALLFALSAACAGLASLGLSQLHRSDEKRGRHDAYVERQAAPVLDLALIPKTAALGDALWRRFTARGHFLDRYVVLDNRVQHGRAGYEVLTPFAADDGATILVDRGWVPLPGDRKTVPDVLAPADPTTISGYLGAEPSVGIELISSAAEAEIMSPQVYRVQRVDLAGLASLLGLDLRPGVLYLDAHALGALAVDWPPPGDGSARHMAYAVQWFAMAVVLGALGLWNLYVRRSRRD